MDDAIETMRLLLGLGEEELSIWQMCLRAVVVYGIAVGIVRLAKKRFMGRATAFDLILAVVLGSIISRVITADAPFLPGLTACLALVGMHWAFSVAAFRWHGFSVLVKGSPRILVRNGRIDWAEMRRTHMSEGDLWEDLRDKGVSDLEQVAEARLERSGEVSVLQRENKALTGPH